MNRLEEYIKSFNTKVSIELLVRIALLFVIVLLIKQTWSIWAYVISVLQSVQKAALYNSGSSVSNLTLPGEMIVSTA